MWSKNKVPELSYYIGEMYQQQQIRNKAWNTAYIPIFKAMTPVDRRIKKKEENWAGKKTQW